MEDEAPLTSDKPLVSSDVSLDEKRFAVECDSKSRELNLREREVIAKERELSSWRSPVVLGLIAATLALAANVIVAYLNNQNTVKVEKQRAQSTLILEAIRTGGADAACKNLIFLVSMNLVDDGTHAIENQCKEAPKGGPSLPVVSQSSSGLSTGFGVQPFGQGPFGSVLGNFNPGGSVVDADSGLAIAGAKVTVGEGPPVTTDAIGYFMIPQNQNLALGAEVYVTVEKAGYQPVMRRLKVGTLLTIDLPRPPKAPQ